MLIMSIATLIGGGLSYWLFTFQYKRRVKMDRLDRGLYLKTPIMMGGINLVMAMIFSFWYISSPEVFASEQEIVWNIGTVFFTLFTIYFYILAIPVSIGEIIKTHLLYRDGHVKQSYLILSMISNGLASLILFFLIIAILS